MTRNFAVMITIIMLNAIGACDSRTPAASGSPATPGGPANAAASAQKLMDQAPGEAEVSIAAQSRNCELVEITSTSWPDDTYRVPASYEDAKVVYEADCKAEGSDQVRRITYEAQFGVATSADTGTQRHFWELRLNQPARGEAVDQSASSNTTEQESGSGNYADGPECNALLMRVQTEVIPCVEDIDAQAAQRLQSWLEITSQRSRIAASNNNNRAAAEIKIDENCLASWRSGIARDFGGSSPYAACAPE